MINLKNKIILFKLSYEYRNENFDIFPCVIQDEKNLVLVDCGYSNSLHLIEEEMINNGLNLKNLTHLFFTPR